MIVAKPPVNAGRPSPNRNGYDGTRRVDAICWHVTAGSFQSSLDWLCNPASKASANYLLDKDGTLYELVEPHQDAWANGQVDHPDTGNPLIARWLREGVNFNQRTISIETVRETSALGQSGGFTAAQVAALVRLTAWLCLEFGLPCDRTHVIRHAQIDSVNRANCPGCAETEMLGWIGRAASLLAPGDPGFPAALLPDGRTSLNGVDFGGTAVCVERVIVSVRNAAGERYSRTWSGHALGPWQRTG